MGVAFPSPKRLAAYIKQEEMARRLGADPTLPVTDIFRYGGMVGSHIHTYSSLPRCLDQARELILNHSQQKQSLPSGTMLFAESLTGSMGRFQRNWHAPAGGLWGVVCLFNQWSKQVAGLLPLAAGVAVAETVLRAGIEVEIKWVNDLHCQGLKLAGLLAQTHVCPVSSEEYILVGIGLNVNNCSFPTFLEDIATSMALKAGREFDLGTLALDLLAKLSWNIGLLTWLDETDQPLSLFMDRYRALCDTVGRRVQFGFDVQQAPQYQALVKGVADDGGLVLHHLQDDVELVEHSGELEYL